MISFVFGCTPSSTTSSDVSNGENMKEIQNLSNGTIYTFSTTQTLTVKNNDGQRLTTPNNEKPISVKLKDVPLSFGDWSGNTINTTMFEEKEPCWYLKNDFGFPSMLYKTEITFSKEKSLPSRVEVFTSDDGYNFTKYVGDANLTETETAATFCLELDSPVLAKAVKYYVFSPLDESLSVLSINSEGERLNERKILSVGKKYTTDSKFDDRFVNKLDDGVKLTDGIYGGAAIKEKEYVFLTPNAKDELMDRNVVNITIDLEEITNVSEVTMSTATPTTQMYSLSHPEFVSVKYSEDGENYYDFSMSYPEGYFVRNDGATITNHTTYMMMRNHTVKARYLKVMIFSNTAVALDEINVWGSEVAVKEPEYDFLTIGESTDLALGANYYVNGKKVDNIDLMDAVDQKVSLKADLTGEAENAIITLKTETYQQVKDLTVNSVKAFYQNSVGAYTYLYFEFDKTNVINAELALSDNTSLTSLTLNAFSNDAFMPLIRGGFYAIFIDALQTGYNAHHFFDEYRTYIHLKGFRELGMDTIIIGSENLNYEEKITLIDPPEELAEKGYRKGIGHGVKDVNEAILNATDKLGMKTYVSTITSLAYGSLPATNKAKEAYIEGALEDANIIIPYIYNLYKDHPSFYGFYLTDETCDYWLQLERNSKTEFTRMLYKGQSEIIRSLDDSLYIAIAPAAWRADFPKNFGEALYNLIKNDVEGERPIIDHVMMQDCLGRENSIAVSNSVYDSFRSYLIECKKGVEKAGGVFMNDAETFDVGYRIKRYDELIRSLSLESSYTNSTLIFDLAHYFSSTGKGSFDEYKYFDNDYVNSRYTKYVKTFLD